MAPFKDLRFLLTGLSTLDSATLKRQVIGLFTLSKWWCESFQHLTPFDLFKRIQLTNLSQLLKGNLSSKKMDPVSFTSLSHYSKSQHFVQKLQKFSSEDHKIRPKNLEKVQEIRPQNFFKSKCSVKIHFWTKIGLLLSCGFHLDEVRRVWYKGWKLEKAFETNKHQISSTPLCLPWDLWNTIEANKRLGNSIDVKYLFRYITSGPLHRSKVSGPSELQNLEIFGQKSRQNEGRVFTNFL